MQKLMKLRRTARGSAAEAEACVRNADHGSQGQGEDPLATRRCSNTKHHFPGATMLPDPTSVVTLHDKTGHAFGVRPLLVSDRRALEHFYAQFEPKRAAQGLPPADIQSVHRWLKGLLRSGHHLVVDAPRRLLEDGPPPGACAGGASG